MENDDAIAAGEGDLVRDDDRMPELAAEAPETFELELDGAVHTLPAALKGAVLRQADYTRKTQELAGHRRTLEADRQLLDERSRVHEGASRDRLRLAALDHQIEEFEGVDWDAYAAEDQDGARSSWEAYQRLGQTREQLAYAVGHHEERGLCRPHGKPPRRWRRPVAP